MSPKARCFSSSPTAFNKTPMIARIVSFALSQRFIVLMAALALMVWGAYLVFEAAHRRLSRSLSAARGDHHAVARPRVGGSRAPDLDSARSGDERHSEDREPALDFAVRALRAGDEFRVRHRSVFRARAGVRAHGGRDAAGRRHARRFSAVQPQRTDLSLRAGEPGPHAAAAEDASKPGCSSASTARFPASPTIPAWAAPPCSIRCC